MVVITVLGLLATFMIVGTQGMIARARVNKAKSDVQALATAIAMYKNDNAGRVPEALEELLQPNDLGHPYLDMKGIPQDPWKNDYELKQGSKTGEFEVVSYGADRQEGGIEEDADISSFDLAGTGNQSAKGF
jgi:general secretion pathway protein G